MRIAMFTEVFLPKVDGIVTRVTSTLDQLTALGHEVLVFAPANPPGYSRRRVPREHMHYGPSKVFRVRSMALPVYPEVRMGLPTPGIAEQLRAFRPDVVHAVNPVWLAAYGVLAARHRRLPLLASYHTDLASYTVKHNFGLLRAPMGTWTRFLHNQAEVNLCTSQQMVDRALELGVRDVDLWPKAVDTQRYHPEMRSSAMRVRLTNGHPTAPLVVYVGRLTHEKDLLDLVEPARALSARGVRFAMVGSGPDRADLERRFAGTSTVFTGYLAGEELAAAYASADVFAFPSTTETLGLVALESMASGVPVVAANAGGIPFVINDGVDGYLVPPHDSRALITRLTDLLFNASRRAELGRAARREAEKYSWRAATERLVEFYRLAIQRHQQRAAGQASASDSA